MASGGTGGRGRATVCPLVAGMDSAVRSLKLAAPFFFFSSRRRHTILVSGWSSDVCSSDLGSLVLLRLPLREELRFGLRLRARLEHRRIGELRRILLLRRRRFGDFLRQPGAGLEFPRDRKSVV